MIGDGWSEDRPRPSQARPAQERVRVAIVTGSRADYGLLRPIMRAVAAREELELLVVAAGSHMIQPALTFRDVKHDFDVADSVPMQVAGRTGRWEDVAALGAGIARFGRSFDRLGARWCVVLGDRIEALAAASAASVGGIALAHVHGGDRAEGVADEAMRHAITKLAHVHFPATPTSAERIVRMGEPAAHVHTVGSSSIDELRGVVAMDDENARELGDPACVVLMHPIGRHAEAEELAASEVISAARVRFGTRVLLMHPNHDPGRQGIVRAIEHASSRDGLRAIEHLPRSRFIALLKRLAERGGLLIGNSSAALIEAAALRLPVVDIGARQGGRERPASVVHIEHERSEDVARAIDAALAIDRATIAHPYGDGRTGERIAAILSRTDPGDTRLLRKRCTY
ncbi:MAG: UDP-N-acetylglucosamine 2-epimerase [Phycisphaerales bacterium]|jgi:UDP-hydrolysing UDP-N-acetyl-D-glucosamine 2-epimerase|nr:UDP-N-acetylglucosamine 2-epimerase [Phycisphaerales bacterium]